MRSNSSYHIQRKSCDQNALAVCTQMHCIASRTTQNSQLITGELIIELKQGF